MYFFFFLVCAVRVIGESETMQEFLAASDSNLVSDSVFYSH